MLAEAVLDGRYQLIEAIGAGGFGQVWKAQDPKVDRLVAPQVRHGRGPRETVRDEQHRNLEDHGPVRRTHGGAYPVESAGFETTLAFRATSHVPEKRRIAAAAAELLGDAGTAGAGPVRIGSGQEDRRGAVNVARPRAVSGGGRGRYSGRVVRSRLSWRAPTLSGLVTTLPDCPHQQGTGT